MNNTINSKAYCKNEAAPEGSDLYYALLFERENNKSKLIVLNAFFNELSNVIFECSDPGIARIKFKWWQEEIDRLFIQQSRHPITKELAQNINLTSSAKTLFQKIIDNYETRITFEQPTSLENCLDYLQIPLSEIWYACNLLGNNLDDNLSTQINQINTLENYLNYLQQPQTYINETRCIIPSPIADLTSLFNLRSDLMNNEWEQDHLFKPLILNLKKQFETIYKRFPQNERNQMKHLLILTRLCIKLCDEIIESGCKLLTKRTSLTPIHKLWIAWHTNLKIQYWTF